MKALWRNELYQVIEAHGDTLELERLDSSERVQVLYSDASLIVDPTCGDLEEAEAILNYRSHCCDCPHESYLTVSIKRSEHCCTSCGETFVDATRTKRYFGREGWN